MHDFLMFSCRVSARQQSVVGDVIMSCSTSGGYGFVDSSRTICIISIPADGVLNTTSTTIVTRASCDIFLRWKSIISDLDHREKDQGNDLKRYMF